jgi:hypothetical protein
MWATFSSQDTEDPFHNLSDDQIEMAYGLGGRDGLEVLVVLYKLNGDIAAQYPTVADMAASGSWNPDFRPAPRVDLSDVDVFGNDVSNDDDGRRQVVHRAVEVDSVKAPLRLLDIWDK